MPASATTGVLAKLGMSPSGAVTEGYEFTGESLAKNGNIIDTAGIRGTRSRIVDRTRVGTYTCSGDITLHPAPAELDNLLPRITGGTKQGDNTVPLAETLPTFQVSIDRVAEVFTYNTCKINRAVFKSGEGQPLELTLSVEALTETVASAGSFPVITIGVAAPYVFMDAVLTIAGTTYQMRDVSLVLDNHLNTGRFMNSVSRTDLPVIDRTVECDLTAPFTADTIGLYNQGVSPFTATVVFTNGVYVLTFTYPALIAPPRSPVVQSKDEEFITLPFVARKSGSNLEVTITNKSS